MMNKNINLKDMNKEQHYLDIFFSEGNIFYKIKQLLIVILGWSMVIFPILITCTSWFGIYNTKILRPWTYKEGIYEIEFISLFLFWTLGALLIFITGMFIIKLLRDKRDYEEFQFEVNTYLDNLIEIEKQIQDKFGVRDKRHHERYIVIHEPENLDIDNLFDLFYEQNKSKNKIEKDTFS